MADTTDSRPPSQVCLRACVPACLCVSLGGCVCASLSVPLYQCCCVCVAVAVAVHLSHIMSECCASQPQVSTAPRRKASRNERKARRLRGESRSLSCTPPPSPALPLLPSEEVDESSECVVCHDKSREAAFFPCGHKCVCIDCAVLLASQVKPECPLCRTIVQGYARIYD